MKKCLILGVLLVGVVIGIYFLYQNCNQLIDENQTVYQEMKRLQLVGVDGEINLVGVEAEYEEIKKEVLELFGNQDGEQETFLKQIEEKKNVNANIKMEMENLSVQISALENQKKELSNQYEVLKKKYNQLLAVARANQNVVSNNIGFPLINQYPTYPTGCESVALTMLLRYYGVNVSPSTVIDRLKKESLPFYQNGIRYGGNPEVGFVGNPYSSSSYGVYEKPIAEVANMFKAGIQVRNNFSFDEVLQLVSNNRPVLVWASMGLSVPYISDSWIYQPTGEKIYWKAGEHAMVIVSYYNNTLIVADPIGGKLKSYSKSLFESRYNYFGRKALYY